jgi:formylglycine-generating enzyme required for sulfatase activity
MQWFRNALAMNRFLLATCLFWTGSSNRAAADSFGSGDNKFDIEFVTIGNPGNAPDTIISPNPGGSVPYTYRMGKFEISEQMIDKANAEGGLGIFKNIRSADKPATEMSWNAAARFVNWLNTSTGSVPAYKFAIQPGEVDYDANANIELWTTGDAGFDPSNLYRNRLARYFLPSADEWYKAAYYDPTSGVYFDYPTGSDSAPTAVASGTAAGTAVFAQYFHDAEPADITLAGGLSPYGTMGQGGNVYEWEETELYDLVNDDSSSARGSRGGSYDEGPDGLLSSSRRPRDPTDELYNLGFRVASVAVPEPSTLLLLLFGSLAVLWRRRRLVCGAVLGALLAFPATTVRASETRTVALSGQQVPGMPDGVNFSSSSVFNSPVLNDAGQTAFVARLTGSGVDSTNDRGIWSEGSGSLALVARQGSHAPGTPSGVNYGNATFANPVLNDAGQTSFFTTNLTGSGVVSGINDSGIWSEGSGTLALVVRKGDHAPGTASGVNFSFLDSLPVLNNAGQTAFRASLTGSGVDGFNNLGIWSEGSGSLALVARGGSQAPGTTSGVNFSFSGNPVRPVLNSAGQTAFAAGLIGSGVDLTNNSGIWSEGSGSLALVARTGSQAPGTPNGVNYSGSRFLPPVLNDAGQTAFRAVLTGSGVDSSNRLGIWSEGSGSLALVARAGSQAPGTANNVNYASLFDPVMNDAGQTAFVAELTGSGVDSTNNSGIWSEGLGSLALVARSGDHAPGTPNGVNFGYINGFFLPYVLNDAGQIAFLAPLTGSGISASNDFGIWATNRGGALQLITREGDPLEVAPGDFRTISFLSLFDTGIVDGNTGNSDGRPSVFNNLGQVAFSASFTDGTSGIFVSNRVAVPEPSTLLLLAAGVCAFVLNRRGRINDARFNHRARKGFVVAIAVSAVIVKAPSTVYAADIRTVALTGAIFDRFDNIQNLVLNDAGQVAFLANSGSDTWSEGSGSLALLVTGGMQAPGLPDGVTFSRSQYDVQGLVLNDAGKAAFGANAGTRGIWSEGSGSLALVARGGNHAPGTSSGVNFSGMFSRPVLNNAGQTAFGAQLTGIGVDSANDIGIWSEGPGALSLVARAGEHAPGTPSGVNFRFQSSVGDRPVLNDAGQVAFAALLVGDGVDATNGEGVWSERAGTLSLVARSGTQAPGAPAGVNFRNFNFGVFEQRLALNNACQTAFEAILSGSDVNAFNNNGIWSEGSGALSLVAREGDHAPGTPSGVVFRDASGSSLGTLRAFDQPRINNAGQTAFMAFIADSAGVNVGSGIWLDDSGNLTLIARTGDHAPGTPDGVNFSTIGALGSFRFHLNDAGQIAFYINLTDGGRGIWATDRNGDLQLIVRTGDQLEVAPGDFRTIAQLNWISPGSTGNSDGRPSSFNSLGQIAFSASFTDSSSGVFVSNHVAVPEPSTLLLLVGSLAALWRRRLVCASILTAVVSISCADGAMADTFGGGANTFDIEFVTIGNPGNAADTTGDPNSAGKVDYAYRMGKFEISEQIIDKANAEGGLGITRTTRGADKPATQTSWNEAARFVNWLNTTSGSTPAYKFAVQPGDIGYDANANIELWRLDDAGYDANNLYRNRLARYFLPSIDEWYKSAYYDPTSGYFDYPTGSDSAPAGVASGTAANTAIHSQSGPANVTLAGGLSPYRTMGQGGNVYEWQETEFDLVNDSSSAQRSYRGSFWDFNFGNMSSVSRSIDNPHVEVDYIGFRVASTIPEPSTLLLLYFGSLAVLWRRRPLVCASILAVAVSISCADYAQAATIDTVPVGNPGNAGDMQSQGTFGAVAYNYRIGKTEVTNAQYTEFLNGVDPTGANALALYSTSMSSSASGGINFNGGAANGSKYEIKSGRNNNPVVFVSWYDSIRFANWLHNGQGNGDTENGAYTLGALGAGGVSTGGSSVTRNADAKWWLPSEDEWYKAAYHKNEGVTGDYWDYPISTDAVPYSDQPPGNDAPTQSSTANFIKSDSIANGYDDGYAVTGSTSGVSTQNYLTDVGAYTLSTSPYGTFDQGGNVWEWNETSFSVPFPGLRGLRGGSWNNNWPQLRALLGFNDPPTLERNNIGFRVASFAVPEPSTLLLLCFGSLAVLGTRKGR